MKKPTKKLIGIAYVRLVQDEKGDYATIQTIR